MEKGIQVLALKGSGPGTWVILIIWRVLSVIIVEVCSKSLFYFKNECQVKVPTAWGHYTIH